MARSLLARWVSEAGDMLLRSTTASTSTGAQTPLDRARTTTDDDDRTYIVQVNNGGGP